MIWRMENPKIQCAAVVYFKNSGPSQTEVLWVGAAAWNDQYQVRNKVAQLVRAGIVPFMYVI